MSKYRDACIAYAEANAEIKRLRREIGEHLGACYEVQSNAWDAAHPHQWSSGIPDEKLVQHLKLAYQRECAPDGYHVDYVNHEGDVDIYLAEVCPHCLAAHKAIQARREAKRKFGIAKRRISVLGATAAKESA